ERFAATGYPAERIAAIQYGYDAQLFRPRTDEAPGRSPTVVMHGSFDQHHLGPIAFETVRLVHAAKPEVLFKFVGRKTPTLDSFATRIKGACPNLKLELPGFVPYGEIAAHLAQATVGWIPYESSEGVHCAFVAKAVEYLGCGIPAASTPLENLQRYFVDEPALRFSQFEPQSLAACLLYWLDMPEPKRRQIGLAAAARVQRELDWPVIARRAVDFFEERTQPQTRTQGNR
ncbi:MAG TPA: glycosyltransferase, partial [Candidatus Limnocylindria bacterium]|nr:glycosyltransferase [Candidatus Limnocylindria bacterium]